MGPLHSVAVVVAASAYLEVAAAYGTLEVVVERVAVVAEEPLSPSAVNAATWRRHRQSALLLHQHRR